MFPFRVERLLNRRDPSTFASGNMAPILSLKARLTACPTDLLLIPSALDLHCRRRPKDASETFFSALPFSASCSLTFNWTPVLMFM